MATKVLDYTGLSYYNTKLTTKIEEEYVKKDGEKVLTDVNFSADDKSKLDKLAEFKLPVATDSVLGGVMIGDRLTVTEAGLLSANEVHWSDIKEAPTEMTPSEHEHTVSDITDFETTLTGKGYQTASDVQAAITAAGHLKLQVETAMPETGADGILYLVPKDSGGDKNIYNEYVWNDDSFELIGDTAPDLTGYAKTTDLTVYAKTADLANYVQNDTLTSTLEDYVQTSALTEYAKTEDLADYMLTADLQNISNEEIDKLFTAAEEPAA